MFKFGSRPPKVQGPIPFDALEEKFGVDRDALEATFRAAERLHLLQMQDEMRLQKVSRAAVSLRRKQRLVSPPGSFARSVLAFVFSKKAFDTVLAQAISDMREEHAEALAAGRHWEARWGVFRDHVGLGLTVVAYIGATVVKKVAGLWKLIP